jgi:hypothetical protein
MSCTPGVLQVKIFGQFHKLAGRSEPRPAIPTGPVLIRLVACLWIAGCASEPEVPPAAGVSPSADVPIDQAWHDAKMVAARAPGRMPAVGSGSSMHPIYGDDTLLVINPIAYEDLRPGMTVAYCNRRGVRVVHRLVVKLADGWRIEGINNDRADDDVVTRKNLIGVVYATFNYDTDEPPAKADQKPVQAPGAVPPGS